jgi:cyclohexadieny/prephenate dehydrogenase
MFKKITIIGMGLIGSSLARVIRKKKISKHIIAHDKSSTVLQKVSKLKIANTIEGSLAKSVLDSDLVIICTPLGTYKNIAITIKPFIKKNCIVTDVGSAKLAVVKILDKIFKSNIAWIPGHPIAGTELSGPEAGFATLFQNRWCILTPVNKKNKTSLKKLIGFWRKTGSRVQTMTPEHHDKVMAITSHIPHLFAYNIVGTASNLESSTKSEVIKYSASGFRDFTRIASSDPTMWKDIMIANSKEILAMLKNFNNDLNVIKKAILKKNSKKLYQLFTKTRKIREDIIKAGQDISKPNFGRES